MSGRLTRRRAMTSAADSAYVQILSRGANPFLRILNKDGRQQVIKPWQAVAQVGYGAFHLGLDDADGWRLAELGPRVPRCTARTTSARVSTARPICVSSAPPKPSTKPMFDVLPT